MRNTYDIILICYGLMDVSDKINVNNANITGVAAECYCFYSITER